MYARLFYKNLIEEYLTEERAGTRVRPASSWCLSKMSVSQLPGGFENSAWEVLCKLHQAARDEIVVGFARMGCGHRPKVPRSRRGSLPPGGGHRLVWQRRGRRAHFDAHPRGDPHQPPGRGPGRVGGGFPSIEECRFTENKIHTMRMIKSLFYIYMFGQWT